MKNNLFLLLLIAITILSSCEKRESESTIHEMIPDIEIIDGMLSFKDQATFDSTVDFLFKMGYNYSLEWCDSLGFTSMNSIYDNAFDEIELITTEEEYYEFKSTYSEIFLFNNAIVEDLSFYLPLSNRRYAPVINIEGDVMIAGNTINFRDIEALNENYYNSRNVLKGTDDSNCYVSTSKRKFWATIYLGILFDNVYTEVHAQKKLLWGWINYRTSYGIIVRSMSGWTGPDLNTKYYTGDIPSGSEVWVGDRAVGATYATGNVEQWSRGVGYDNRCLNHTFSYPW